MTDTWQTPYWQRSVTIFSTLETKRNSFGNISVLADISIHQPAKVPRSNQALMLITMISARYVAKWLASKFGWQLPSLCLQFAICPNAQNSVNICNLQHTSIKILIKHQRFSVKTISRTKKKNKSTSTLRRIFTPTNVFLYAWSVENLHEIILLSDATRLQQSHTFQILWSSGGAKSLTLWKKKENSTLDFTTPTAVQVAALLVADGSMLHRSAKKAAAMADVWGFVCRLAKWSDQSGRVLPPGRD